MKRLKLYILQIILAAIALSSCKKETDVNKDNWPSVPVVVINRAETYNFPVVETSLSAGGVIKIELGIPNNVGRSIKEITKVATGTTVNAINTGASYNVIAIPGNGNRVVFTTSLAEYKNKTGAAIPSATQAGTTVGAAALAQYFYFKLTLDNDETIVTTAVRVYVKP